MWLFTKYGFYSVVSARMSAKPNAPVDPARVMIRARKREHLDNLIARFTIDPRPGDRTDLLDWLTVKVVETKATDYPFRLFVPKPVWADAAHDLATEIGYDNFKSEVHATADDPSYLSALHEVWGAGRRMR
jgi:hypothetical protein